jgi:hypothetical protein
MKRVAALAVITWMLPGSAMAQDEGFDAHGFHLAAHKADMRDALSLQRPSAFRQLDWYAGGLLEYAKSPLVVEILETGERQAVLDNLFVANITTGVAAHDRIRFDLGVPIFLTSTGPDGGQGADFGDLRLAAMTVPFLGRVGPGDLSIGVVPYLDVPSGDPTSHLGSTKVTGGATAAASFELSKITITGNTGVSFQPKLDDALNMQGSDTILAGAGVGYLASERTGVNLELLGHLTVPAADIVGSTSPVELISSVRHQPVQGGFVTGGLATALSPGAGAAALRLFVGGGYGRTSDTPVEEQGTSALQIKVTRDGKPASDAIVTLHNEDGAAETIAYNGSSIMRDIPLDSHWTIEAKAGPCTRGSVELDAVSAESDAVVDMERSLGARLQFRIRDSGGQAIANVTATVYSDDPECSPENKEIVLEDGTGDQPIGVGRHEIRLQAPGFAPATERVELEQWGSSFIDVVLTRTSR